MFGIFISVGLKCFYLYGQGCAVAVLRSANGERRLTGLQEGNLAVCRNGSDALIRYIVYNFCIRSQIELCTSGVKTSYMKICLTLF